MAQPLRVTETSDLTRAIDALVTHDGTGAHPYVQSRKLIEGRGATRNLADAIHFLGMLHGRHPGLVEHAANRAVTAPERHWFEQAVNAFGRERAYLSSLGVGAGPMPSTAGQQQCESTIIAQSHAIEMLGRSERVGCGLGAALALALDWRSIRAVLDSAAARLDVQIRPAALPDLHETIALIASYAGSQSVERAMLFGAQQLLAQHRGMWDLLSTREVVRTDY
ncbi:MAG: hypothetical protein ABL909_02730 [Sphingopyxis sp.]